jgi:hypothetical protein
MLADVCQAIATTVDLAVDRYAEPRQVLEWFPRVLDSCDQLPFDDYAQALAYLILHMPDRYCRMFQVLERLVTVARLPIGRSDNFAAVDIGAGPGPGIFAIRGFYAALAHNASVHDPQYAVATLGHADVVERGRAMSSVMHHFAEARLMAERGHFAPVTDSRNPSEAELEQSATPFGAMHRDFTTLDIPVEHQQARQRLADELYWEDSELSRAGANRLAQAELIRQPSAYALAVMMNFLTSGSDALQKFSEGIDRLMARSLVPGGTILVLGSSGAEYQEIYRELDRRAIAAHLTIVDGFAQPLQAGHRADERAAIRTLTRGIWQKLGTLAGDVSHTKKELRELGRDKIFDSSRPFRFPRFQVRAYRRGV